MNKPLPFISEKELIYPSGNNIGIVKLSKGILFLSDFQTVSKIPRVTDVDSNRCNPCCLKAL